MLLHPPSQCSAYERQAWIVRHSFCDVSIFNIAHHMKHVKFFFSKDTGHLQCQKWFNWIDFHALHRNPNQVI